MPICCSSPLLHTVTDDFSNTLAVFFTPQYRCILFFQIYSRTYFVKIRFTFSFEAYNRTWNPAGTDEFVEFVISTVLPAFFTRLKS